MERGQVPSEMLSITSTLKKDPIDYSKNSYRRIVGNQLNAKEGDSITYYKSSTKGMAHSNPAFIDIGKYLDMMQSTFEKQVELLGYDFLRDVVGVKNLADF
jgi:hypothetical protein